jgi:armadillo repeat-containing protein 1
MSDVREVVGSLKILAAEPENRSHIIQDETCLQGVINFLQNPDPKIVFMALEVVQLLADGQENRSQLAKQAELVKSVRKIMLDISADPQAKRIASSIYASLQSHFQPSSSTSSTQAPLRDTTNTPRGSEAGTGGVGLSIFSQKVSNSLSSAKTHIYYIPSLTNDTARSQIESKLLQIKGVVSFLLDVKTHRATIRSLLAPMGIPFFIALNL